MNRSEDVRYMRDVIDRSESASVNGERPFAALLVEGEEVLGVAINTVESTGDPLDHAETNLVSAVVRDVPLERRQAATMYASAEPCPMCATAAYYAGIRRVVFGAPSSELRELLGPGFDLGCREVLAAAPIDVEVLGPLLGDEAVTVIEESGYGTADWVNKSQG